jgi:hypothetical protein
MGASGGGEVLAHGWSRVSSSRVIASVAVADGAVWLGLTGAFRQERGWRITLCSLWTV